MGEQVLVGTGTLILEPSDQRRSALYLCLKIMRLKTSPWYSFKVIQIILRVYLTCSTKGLLGLGSMKLELSLEEQ